MLKPSLRSIELQSIPVRASVRLPGQPINRRYSIASFYRTAQRYILEQPSELASVIKRINIPVIKLLVLLTTITQIIGCAPGIRFRPGEIPTPNRQISGFNQSSDSLRNSVISSGQVLHSPAAKNRVSRIFKKLLDATPTTGHWKVMLVDSDVLNAMTSPGNYVFVFRGLLDTLSKDEEVAAVLAHEISHRLALHEDVDSGEQLGEMLGKLAAIAAGAAIASQPGATEQQVGDVMNSVATLGAGLTTFRYSKDKEREADQIGLFLMADAGYDPQAGSLVWARLAAHQQAESNDFLNTHPLNEERYRNAIRLMPLAQERYRKALRKPPTKSSRIAADKTDPTLEFQSNQAFAAIQQGDFTSAEITLQNMLSRSPNYKGAHNMFGILQLKKGDPTSALKAFNRGLKIAPHDATLIYNIACSYALKGDREAAFTHLERAFSRDPQLVETAEDDSDLESLHDDPRFNQLLNRQFTVSAPIQVGGNTFSIN